MAFFFRFYYISEVISAKEDNIHSDSTIKDFNKKNLVEKGDTLQQ